MARKAAQTKLEVVMVTAECRGLAQVGGLADVVADLGRSLCASGVATSILMPGYESVSGGEVLGSFPVDFGGSRYDATLKRAKTGGVNVFLISSREFFSGSFAPVYVDSGPLGHGPFEDDALRFSFFCSAAASLLQEHEIFSRVCAVHCHDWHAGTLIVLARLSRAFPRLADKPFVFTVHNLDYQGIRPMLASGNDRPLSSFQSWFPSLAGDILRHPGAAVLSDRRYPGCYNPMRAAILLSDRVTAVSPTYAREITLPDDSAANFVGGRGLEEDIRSVDAKSKLTGILNGISYETHSPALLSPRFDVGIPEWWKGKLEHKRRLFALLRDWASTSPRTRNDPVWSDETLFLERPLAVAVTRLASQKVSLLLEHTPEGRPVFEKLSSMPLAFAVLGTGEMLDKISSAADSAHCSSFLVIPRFDPALARALYAGGDLFLMPSDFEPCGIGQLIAMAYGTIPIASKVGGLADTIRHNETGFLFSAPTRAEAASRFIDTIESASSLYRADAGAWRAMQEKAMAQRFAWDRSAAQYAALYRQITQDHP